MCSENYNIKPDIVLIGKSLGAGYLPISLCIANNEIMSCIKEGEHGSTFGGNPLASLIAAETIEYLHQNKYENIVNNLSLNYKTNLKKLVDNFKFIKEVREYGLLFGIEISNSLSAEKIVQNLTDYGILIKSTKKNTIRLTPPFVITEKETEELFDGLYKCFSKN